MAKQLKFTFKDTLLADDLGNAIVADWKYKEE